MAPGRCIKDATRGCVLQVVAPGGGRSTAPRMRGTPQLQEPHSLTTPTFPPLQTGTKQAGRHQTALLQATAGLCPPPVAQPALTPLSPAHRGWRGRASVVHTPLCRWGCGTSVPEMHRDTFAPEPPARAESGTGRAGASHGTRLGDGTKAPHFGPPCGGGMRTGQQSSFCFSTHIKRIQKGEQKAEGIWGYAELTQGEEETAPVL